jgi:hypothetical protein
MTLENLVAIGKLKSHGATAGEIERLLASAKTSLADARRSEISPNSRLDLAYKGIMQASLAALMASGFRPSTSEPGHHQLVIQLLPKTLGVAPEKIRVLDAFRRARNVADYEGDVVEDSVVAECIAAAVELLALANTKLARRK